MFNKSDTANFSRLITLFSLLQPAQLRPEQSSNMAKGEFVQRHNAHSPAHTLTNICFL